MKVVEQLGVKQVDKLAKTVGRHAVGGVRGLCLCVTGDNARSWLLRVKIGDKRREIGLGSYEDVSLAKAREKARELREQVVDGVDPLEERDRARAQARAEQAKRKTFKQCAEAYVDAHKSGWKSDKHAKQWTATLETYAYEKLGDLPVGSIDTALVREVLQQQVEGGKTLWATKTETASRLRGRIESVLDWAKVNGYREGENPARWRGHLDKLLPARSKVQKVKHHAALPYAELGEFMVELGKREGISPRALEFAILTATRSQETRLATWDEIDLETRLWTIPKERMKREREHRVPLSDTAIALLKTLPRIEGSNFLFPAARGGALSDMALTAVLKRMDRAGLTQHGFRSTFRDWAGETTGYPREVIEHALAHGLKDQTEAAYQRGDLLAKRARLMADWAIYCGTVQTPAGNVVGIKQGAAV